MLGIPKYVLGPFHYRGLSVQWSISLYVEMDSFTSLKRVKKTVSRENWPKGRAISDFRPSTNLQTSLRHSVKKTRDAQVN